MDPLDTTDDHDVVSSPGEIAPMAQRSLDRQEYDDIRHWLAGRKPAAKGRTWRRQMQIQVQKTLPRSVRSIVYAIATLPTHLLTTTLSISLILSFMPQIFALFGMPVTFDNMPQPTIPMPGEIAMRALMQTIMSIIPYLSAVFGAVYLLVLGSAIFIAGD